MKVSVHMSRDRQAVSKQSFGWNPQVRIPSMVGRSPPGSGGSPTCCGFFFVFVFCVFALLCARLGDASVHHPGTEVLGRRARAEELRGVFFGSKGGVP